MLPSNSNNTEHLHGWKAARKIENQKIDKTVIEIHIGMTQQESNSCIFKKMVVKLERESLSLE